MLLFMTISFQMFPDCVLGPGIWVMGNGKCNFIFGFWWLGGDSHPHPHLLQPVWLQFSPQGAARVHCSHTSEDWPVIAKDEEPGPGLWASEGLYSARTPGKKKWGWALWQKKKEKQLVEKAPHTPRGAPGTPSTEQRLGHQEQRPLLPSVRGKQMELDELLISAPQPHSHMPSGGRDRVNELNREPETVSRISHRKEGSVEYFM